MATYTPIEHGKANWDKDLNDNFAKIFGGVTDDSGWVNCVTLLNGAHNYYADQDDSMAIRRRVLDFVKFKIVMISGVITLPLESIVTNTVVANLPAGLPTGQIAPSVLMPGSLKSVIRYGLYNGGTQILLENASLDPAATNNFYLPINFIYIS